MRNLEAARLSGVNTDFWKITVYSLSGAICGLAGLMLVGAIGHGSLRFLSRNKRNKEH